MLGEIMVKVVEGLPPGKVPDLKRLGLSAEVDLLVTVLEQVLVWWQQVDWDPDGEAWVVAGEHLRRLRAALQE